MNKLTLLTIIIAIVGFIPAGAFADTDHTALDAADFFYGVVNQNPVVEQSKALKESIAKVQSIDLSAADFFYGVNKDEGPIVHSIETGRNQKVNVAASKKDPLTPGTFYGYTEPVLVKERCANC